MNRRLSGHPNVWIADLLVRSGKYTTAAGMASGIDLALDRVARDYGHELALKTSQRMVLYLNRFGGQSQFGERQSIPSAPADRFQKILNDIAENPAGNLSNQVIAKRFSISEYHLVRPFRERTGTTPARWLERVRFDAARTQLESSLDSIDVIAIDSGFNSTKAFRQAFHRIMAMTPVQLATR
ncbi:MAG: GlxA family transcriptional regulator [Granulosicoccus sp.]